MSYNRSAEIQREIYNGIGETIMENENYGSNLNAPLYGARIGMTKCKRCKSYRVGKEWGDIYTCSKYGDVPKPYLYEEKHDCPEFEQK